MAKQLTISIAASGVRETVAAFRGLPKEAQQAIRKASSKLADRLATSAAAAAVAEGSQAALVAKTVRPGFDRVPVVQAGGTRRLGSRKAPAWKLLFGAEFGSNEYTQFPRTHQGRTGIWFFPTIERESSAIISEWQSAADDIIRAFAGRGD